MLRADMADTLQKVPQKVFTTQNISEKHLLYVKPLLYGDCKIGNIRLVSQLDKQKEKKTTIGQIT